MTDADTCRKKVRAATESLRQPLVVAIQMLKRDDRPDRDGIANELEQKLGGLRESVEDLEKAVDEEGLVSPRPRFKQFVRNHPGPDFFKE